jgi:glycosyltransferase involved in cell wall biosynthesis
LSGQDISAAFVAGTASSAGAAGPGWSAVPPAADGLAPAGMNRLGQTICLNMIVRNEAPVIRRCLDSVMPIIDSWVIVDTGSTDGTQDIVREHLAGRPGALHERPWVDFAHNRNEALDLARGQADYVFAIDADEVLDVAADFAMPSLDADSYNVEVHFSGCRYLRRALLRDALSWRYVGVLHEHTVCDEARTERFLPGLVTRPHRDGARARDAGTYRRDALILEKALVDEPDNARYLFYLAQSYRDAGDLELAVRHYRRRLELGGWPEELFYSRYQIGVARELIGHPWPEVMEEYLAAWQMMPSRAEPLYRIGLHYQRVRDYAVSHLFLGRAMGIEAPGPDRLFVEQALYDHLVPIEYAVACFYVGDHEAAIRTNNRLLSEGRAPPGMVDLIVRNRRFSVDSIAPIRPGGPTGGPLTC